MENKKISNSIVWARITAELLGWPVSIILLCKLASTTFFTLTCQTAGWRCEYALTAPGQLAGVVAGTYSTNQEARIDHLSDQIHVLTQAMHEVGKELGMLEAVEEPKKGKKN
jgi:hypothetical protein